MSYEQYKANPTSQTRYIFDTLYFENIRRDRIVIPDGSIALIHHLISLYPFSAEIFENIDRPILQKFAAFITTSQFTKIYLRSYGIDKPIVVIEPALKTTISRTTPRAGKINAIMVNNIVPRKGVLPFLEAIVLEKIPPDYRIKIVGDMKGDSAYSKACTETVHNDPLLKRTVQFLGLQDDVIVTKLYSKSNLFISASYMETFGMSIQEASNHRLPLLVLEGGNTSNHVVPGVNGWFEHSMKNLVKRFAHINAHPYEFVEIQKSAYGFQHPYAQTHRDGAALFLKFINELN